MSVEQPQKKLTIPEIIEYKSRGEKIAALTAYDFLMAEMLDQAGMDIILIGDSAAMVIGGFPTTLQIGMEQMLYHSEIVARAVKHALVVADMPFLSFQVSEEKAIENAGRFLHETRVEAVKIEGGEQIIPLVRKMTAFGIPVMGHLGLTPQSIRQFGSYKLQGKDPEMARRMVENAKALEQAGAFSIVLEKIPASLAEEITTLLKIPTIGIGAGPGCDGQILVSHEMLGIFDKFKPRFVRRYAELGSEMRDAFGRFLKDVKKGNFPDDSESFS
ncbi:MAG: 3-methyl-2-oxobutanoate hydroxymethyltransferase [Calditrichia bacterium]